MLCFSSVKKQIFLCLLYIGLFPSFLSAKVIRFPEKELADEYVFPIFDSPQAVLNRNVSLRRRFEIKLSGILRTDEPFYFPFSALAGLSFYWNEAHGIGLTGLFFPPGLNKRGEEMKAKGQGIQNKNGEVVSYFNAALAPSPFFGGFATYHFSPLYGKISITKATVFNFALYTFLGLGTLALKHGPGPLHIIPATHFGLGQKIYFGSYFALDGGIDFMVYRGPEPVSSQLQWKPSERAPARPPYNEFEKSIFLRFLARVGIVILL